MAITTPPAAVYLRRTSPLTATSAGLGAEPVARPRPRPRPVGPEPDARRPTQPIPTTLPGGGLPYAEPLGELPPSTAKGPTPEEQATAHATAGSPSSLLGALRGMRERTGGRWTDDHGSPTELAEMASAMAHALGMSEADARLLVDAMSRGGPDARTLAEGVNALRAMPESERATWLDAWLPNARTSAQAITYLADATTVKSIGASDDIAQVLSALAALTFTMVNRAKTELEGGMSVAEGADRIRALTEKRVGSAKGADAILGEMQSLNTAAREARRAREAANAAMASLPPPREGRAEALAKARELAAQADAAEAKVPAMRTAFATDLAARYGVSLDQAYALVDAMSAEGDVAPMVAEGLHTLEQLDTWKGNFAATFFQTAIDAALARASAHSDVFSRELNVMTPEEASPIAALANLNASMASYLKLKTRQDAQASATVSATANAAGSSAAKQLRVLG